MKHAVKRAIDVVLSAVALLLLAPLFVAIALTIKVTDPGRVFYRHRRLGGDSSKFYVYKFRSMREEYSTGEDYGRTDAMAFAKLGRPDLIEEFNRCQKVRQDPRVTPVGAFLRRTSLDELPQLVNILRGDISLVGPRPIVEAELSHYTEVVSAKPGLTGLWQVSGRNDVSYDERVQLDRYYAEHWSLWLDLRIIARTAYVVLHRKGAY